MMRLALFLVWGQPLWRVLGLQKVYEEETMGSVFRQREISKVFRSFNPHMMHSYSFAKAVTPHLYMGTVIESQPILQVKDEYLEQHSRLGFAVNGYITIPAVEKQLGRHWSRIYQNEGRKKSQGIKHVVVLQIESNVSEQIPIKISMTRIGNGLLLDCRYNNESLDLFITLESNGETQSLWNTSGFKLNAYNFSMDSAVDNWRLTFDLEWIDFLPLSGDCSDCRGLVLQLQHFEELLLTPHYLRIDTLTPHQLFSLKEYAHRGTPLKNVSHHKSETQGSSVCAQAATTKLFQGLSYAYGSTNIVNGSYLVFNRKMPLLSFTPSRTRFPWGFLWDDGFHCEVAVRSDSFLAINVIESWLDTMLPSGWIPREQNRGEARERLCNCPKFMNKDLSDGNPPTLILALSTLLRRQQLGTALSKSHWFKLRKWYSWFNTTLQSTPHLYRWKDSVKQRASSYTSGMDDFPRPLRALAHIDLQSWMYFFASFMRDAASLYDESSALYAFEVKEILGKLTLFQDPVSHRLMDISEDGSHSTDFGYPSLLPLAFNMLEQGSLSYKATIQGIRYELDTDFGLSSISMLNPHYLQTPDAYWRGPVWVNINYLVLRGLNLYYPQQKGLYSKLRQDLLRTVCDNFIHRGFFYENYINNQGSFSHPFNGWTSLIAVIESEDY